MKILDHNIHMGCGLQQIEEVVVIGIHGEGRILAFSQSRVCVRDRKVASKKGQEFPYPSGVVML